MLYMIRGDKFRFIDNIESWKKRGEDVLWIQFEDLLMDPQNQIKYLSEFLSTPIVDIDCWNRKSRKVTLPSVIADAVHKTYSHFEKKHQLETRS